MYKGRSSSSRKYKAGIIKEVEHRDHQLPAVITN